MLFIFCSKFKCCCNFLNFIFGIKLPSDSVQGFNIYKSLVNYGKILCLFHCSCMERNGYQFSIYKGDNFRVKSGMVCYLFRKNNSRLMGCFYSIADETTKDSKWMFSILSQNFSYIITMYFLTRWCLFCTRSTR